MRHKTSEAAAHRTRQAEKRAGAWVPLVRFEVVPPFRRRLVLPHVSLLTAKCLTNTRRVRRRASERASDETKQNATRRSKRAYHETKGAPQIGE